MTLSEVSHMNSLHIEIENSGVCFYKRDSYRYSYLCMHWGGDKVAEVIKVLHALRTEWSLSGAWKEGLDGKIKASWHDPRAIKW